MNLQPILQVIVLSLVIYGFLRLVSALLEALHSQAIPFRRKDSVRHRGGKKRSRRGRIRRTAPGSFTIELEERRPRGKPKGALGGGRTSPKSWERVREAIPRTCHLCGAQLPAERGLHKIQRRLVIDLEKLDRCLLGTRTLWLVHWVRCPYCGGLVSGGDMVNAPKGHIYGYGVIAYAIHHLAKLPSTAVADDLAFILEGDAPTSQTIRDWRGKVAGWNLGLYSELLELAKREGCLQVDESGLPMDGERWWMWVISARNATLYLASQTRGHEAVEPTLSDYGGTLVTDFWKAYDKLPQSKQRCLTHLYREASDLLCKHVKAQKELRARLERSREDRELKEELESGGAKRRGRPRKLMILSREQGEEMRLRMEEHGRAAEALYRLAEFLLKTMGGEFTADKAKEEILDLLEEHRGVEEICQGYRRLKARMLNHMDELFRFLEEPRVDSHSTNRAERMVKRYAELRRVIPCWRSRDSAMSHAQLLSYYTTWSQAGLEPWGLSQLLARGEWRAISREIHGALDKPLPGEAHLQFHPIAGVGGS